MVYHTNIARPKRVFLVGVNQTNLFGQPVFPSISSHQAFNGVLYIIKESNLNNSELYIANVVGPLELPTGQCMDGGSSSEKNKARQKNEANVLVQKLINICSKRGITAHPLVIESNNVGPALVQASENIGADVLVIGNRGRDVNPFESVSSYCTGNARTSDVWVVPRNLEDMSLLEEHINGHCTWMSLANPTPAQRLGVYQQKILDPAYD